MKNIKLNYWGFVETILLVNTLLWELMLLIGLLRMANGSTMATIWTWMIESLMSYIVVRGANEGRF